MNLHVFLIHELFRLGLPPEGAPCFYRDLSQPLPGGLRAKARSGPLSHLTLGAPTRVAELGALKDT